MRRLPIAMSASTAAPVSQGLIETRFRAARSSGRKLLVPYIAGGMTPDWLDALRAMAASGADAIEVGIPFSDPIMDGPVIQEASTQALARGATPLSVVSEAGRADVGVPVIAMTSYNIAFRAGHERFARMLADHGVHGSILPDLSLEESLDWRETSERIGVENVMLVAPTTPDDRMAVIAGASRGFVYGVGSLGVTGERVSLGTTASTIATRLKAATDRPVLVGIGISTGEQAAEVAAVADGVIVGASVVRRLLEGGGPAGVSAWITELRTALDGAR
jgi:tryptophan synthase alpha chain